MLEKIIELKKKKKKAFIMFFGKSHKICLFPQKNILIKKMSKYRILVTGSVRLSVKFVSNKIFQIRTVNCYTKRGLKLISRFFIKRRGKKG